MRCYSLDSSPFTVMDEGATVDKFSCPFESSLDMGADPFGGAII